MPARNQAKTASVRNECCEAVVSAGNNAPGDIRITSAAVAAVVRRAACSVDGVTRIAGNSLVDNIAEFVGSKKVMDRAIQLSFDGSSVEVVVAVNIRYGVALPDIAANVQKSIVQQIQDLTGLQASRVDVIIREMEFPDNDGNE